MNLDVGATIALGIFSALILLYGWRRGFFTPISSENWIFPIKLTHILGAFAIYFSVSFLIAQIVIPIFRKEIILHFTAFSSLLNFGASFLIFCFLALYVKWLPKEVGKEIIRKSSARGQPLSDDIWTAIFAWCLAFPLVLFVSQSLELLINWAFSISQLPDQNAVQFLKSTLGHPVYFSFATLSIILLAPLIEETLFRGFLQSYIRQHLGPKQAIFITSVCFSLFHFSGAQGLGNISIIIPLFILALLLGYLYEKRGSLLAPMALHSIFNTVSVINLYLFGGFTTGI